MDWGIIGTAILGGGIVGQIVTLIGTHYLADKREYRKWRLSQRHIAIIEILDVLTSNPTKSELSEWTHKIRCSSLKIHVLYKDGTAPEKLSDCLEVVFRLAKNKKDGEQNGNWNLDFKNSVSNLRKQLSKSIDMD